MKIFNKLARKDINAPECARKNNEKFKSVVCGALVLGSMLSCSYYAATVTFKVDMTGVSGANGGYLAGDLNGWANIISMTHEGDNIYSYTTDITGSGEYYFLKRSSWSKRESVPTACAGGQYNDNRLYNVSTEQIFAFEYATCTSLTTTPPTNGAPSFNSDPLNKSDAPIDIAYSASIANDATDPESDTLTFSKVSGPAWLTIASDGALSGTPVASDEGLNVFQISVIDNGGSATSVSATLNIDVTSSTPPSSDRVSIHSDNFDNGDISSWTTSGTVGTHSSAAYNGSALGVRLKKTSSFEKSFDLSGYIDVHVNYARLPTGLDVPEGSEESLRVKWFDGTDWNPLENAYIDWNGWATRSFVLPPYADNNANFKLRFELDANLNNETVFIDELDITALPIGTNNGSGLQGSFESKFKKYQPGQQFNSQANSVWTDVAWKNDRIHKQLILWSDANLSNISVTATNLTGSATIDASNVSIRFAEYVKADKNGAGSQQNWFPDTACYSQDRTVNDYIEITDKLSTVPVTSLTGSGDPIKVWLTIDVPSSATAGEYSGAITVSASGETAQTFDIDLTVADKTLADASAWEFHLDLWQFPMTILNRHNEANPGYQIAPYSTEHFNMLQPVYEKLADVGQKTITTYMKGGALGEASMVKWTKKTNGTWEYDFTNFDLFVTTLQSWGITKQINAFSMLGWEETKLPYWDEVTSSEVTLTYVVGGAEFTTRWNDFLTAFKAHLVTKGWFDKTYLYMDESYEASVIAVVEHIEAHDAAWKIGLTQGRWMENTLRDRMDDISPLLETFVDPGADRTGKVTTFYTSCFGIQPNNYVSADVNLADNTWMAWHVEEANIDGYLKWAFDNWRLSDVNDIRDNGNASGDFSFVYRADNNSPATIYSSMRLELLREGIQDYEKIQQLKTELNTCGVNLLNAETSKFSFAFEDDVMNSNSITLVTDGQKLLKDLVTGAVCP